MDWAWLLDFAKAGNSMAARIAMMAITTKSSIKVNPSVLGRRLSSHDSFDRIDFIGFCSIVIVGPNLMTPANNVKPPSPRRLPAILLVPGGLGLRLACA